MESSHLDDITLLVPGPNIPEYKETIPRYGSGKNIFSNPNPVYKREFFQFEEELSPEAEKILSEPNAGGRSIYSEAYAMQILSSLYSATDLIPEMKIQYVNEWWKKCDFIVTIDSIRYGTSVTRVAFSKLKDPDDLDLKISSLLMKKLSGLLIAQAGVEEEYRFEKTILFAWSGSTITTSLLIHTFYHLCDPSLRKNTSLVVIQVEKEEDLFHDFPDRTMPKNFLLFSNL